MIAVGGKAISRIRLNQADIKAAYLGPKRVWDRIEGFKQRVLADGGIFLEDLFRAEFARAYPLIQNEAVGLIIPGAYKAGVIYGMNVLTGEMIPCTFSRASIGTYFDVTVVLQVAPENMPRIDYSLGYPAYALEKSNTGLVTYTTPENLSQIPSYNRISVRPSGNSSFPHEIVFDRNEFPENTQVFSRTEVGSSLLPDTKYTITILIKANFVPNIIFTTSVANPRNIRVILGTHASGYIADVKQIDGDLYLVTVVCQTSPDGYQGGSIGIFRYTTDPDYPFSVLYFQVEQGQFPTSLIQTSGSQVTRAKDNLSIPDLIGNEGSVFMDFEIPDLSGLAGSFIRRGINNFGNFLYRNVNSSITHLLMFDGSETLSRAATNNPGKNKSCSSIQEGGVKRLAVNGSGNENALSGNMNAGSDFALSYSANETTFHLRSLAFIPRQLTNQEHIDITL